MQRPHAWRVAALATAALTGMLAVAMAGCAGPAVTQSPADPAPEVLLIDADRSGAILLFFKGYRGIRRDGTTAWQAEVGPDQPDAVGCLAACPDAILSGNALAANGPGTADPVPQLVLNGQRLPVDAPASLKRRILTANGPNDFVLAGGDAAGRGWLQVRRGDATERLDLPGPRVAWSLSADSGTALSVQGKNALWFERRDGRWRPSGLTVTITGGGSCVSPDGTLALLLGQRPALLDRAGSLKPVGQLKFASDCAWSAQGFLVAEYGLGGGGLTTRLELLSAAGEPVWAGSVAGESRVTADPRSARVAYVDGGWLVERDAVSGEELRRVPGVRAARYDGEGGLVVASPGGEVRWLPS